MADTNFFPSAPPMWVGWNSFYSDDTVPTEKIWYLPQINLSSTSSAVVIETLKRAQKMAAQWQIKTIPVTYDLAIAAMALEIQAAESQRFDNIFVALGAFHIEISMFSVIGKYISESGGPNLLNYCHIIEQGSLTSFLSGKGTNGVNGYIGSWQLQWKSFTSGSLNNHCLNKISRP